jgi:hypothetical protein
MSSRIKRTVKIAAESDYEIHRMAKKWGTTVTAARERCYRFAAAHMKKVGGEDLPMNLAADLRQAEANVERLRGK